MERVDRRDHELASLFEQLGRAVQRLERARVGPPTLDHPMPELAPFDVPSVHIRDLQFPTIRTFTFLDFFKDRTVIHVDAYDRLVGGRVFGFFNNC